MSLAFWCVGLAFLAIYALKIPVAIAMKQQQGYYDNQRLRDKEAQLTGWGKRAYAAHQNAFEGFAPFAVAVMMAYLGGGDAFWIDVLALIYLLARVFYTIFYLANRDTLRSSAWIIGFLATLALFILPLWTRYSSSSLV